MSTEGWIFMVGFRVFDVGLLIAWLIWFFRLRDDGADEPPDEGGGGGGGGGRDSGPRRGPGGGGIRLPTGLWPAGWRRRDGHAHPLHRVGRPGRVPARRVPARVRSPAPRGPVRVRGAMRDG